MCRNDAKVISYSYDLGNIVDIKSKTLPNALAI